jgi:DNA-binding response OmpR family regulator
MRLLVVDHDRRLADALADRWAVEHVGGWIEARRHLERTTFDALVLDERTVGEPGLRLLARRRAEGDRVPALLLRASRSGVAELIDALAAGVTDCLREPVDFEAVDSKLMRLLSGRTDHRSGSVIPSRPPATHMRRAGGSL